MGGYLRGLLIDGDSPAARILQAISDAGDSYHNTDSWADPYDEDTETEVDKIKRIVLEECERAAKGD